MKLADFINICKHSELNTLSVKDDTEALVSFVNLGLLELYGIFALRTEELTIDLQTGKYVYDLPEDFMYLIAAYEPPTTGTNQLKVPINEEGNPHSVNTINFRQLQIPLSITGTFISVIYVVKPNNFTEEDLDQELPIPDSLIQPLMNFVAYKAHGAISLDGQQREGDVYFSRFLRACEERKKQGTSIAADDLSMSTRLENRGFP